MTDNQTAETEGNGTGYRILVNGTQETVSSETVTYDEVTKLAYPTPPVPNATYTVTYRNAEDGKFGSLVQGGPPVEVKKNGTVFDVDPTGKS